MAKLTTPKSTGLSSRAKIRFDRKLRPRATANAARTQRAPVAARPRIDARSPALSTAEADAAVTAIVSASTRRLGDQIDRDRRPTQQLRQRATRAQEGPGSGE